MWCRYRVMLHFECQLDLMESHLGAVVEHTFGIPAMKSPETIRPHGLCRKEWPNPLTKS